MKTILMTVGFVLALGMLGFAWHKHGQIQQRKAHQAARAIIDLRGGIAEGIGATIASAEKLLAVYDAGLLTPQQKALLPYRHEIEALTVYPNILEKPWSDDYPGWLAEADAAEDKIREASRSVAAQIDAALPLLK